MRDVTLEVPDPVRRKAQSTGPVGKAWLAGLAVMVSELATEWALSVGPTLSGGTEAFVAEVTMADGREAVLKVGLPGRDPAANELRAMLAGRGRGYANIYRHDQAREAMLLERLGPQLDEFGLSVDAQIEVICATLAEAWEALPESSCFMTGAEKAVSLSDFIEATWLEVDRPCSERTIETAFHYAEQRRRSFEPDFSVLAHGDAHAGNTLLVPGHAWGRFKFVDPDGLFVERAYDLAISMREWTSELLAGDPLMLGVRRCHQLARLSGVDPESIWQWGFIERTSTGLLCTKIGLEGARDMLAIADAWASGLPE